MGVMEVSYPDHIIGNSGNLKGGSHMRLQFEVKIIAMGAERVTENLWGRSFFFDGEDTIGEKLQTLPFKLPFTANKFHSERFY